MASDEDARTAARRIVEQVLAEHDATRAPAGAIADGVVGALEPDVPPAEARLVAGSVAEELTEDTDLEDLDRREARARARALVDEVLASHGGGDRTDDPVAASSSAPTSSSGVATTVDAAGAPTAPATDSPDTTARLRARELVAATLAEAEAREAAARAEAEAEERAAREAEERAAREAEERAAREAEERAAREAEERAAREREAADRERRTEPTREQPTADGTVSAAVAPDADPGATAPLSIAELAAAERASGPPEGSRVTDEREPAGATAVVDRRDPVITEAAQAAVSSPGVADAGRPEALEAVVEPDSVADRPRTGRWLVASILGAIALAVVFPLAVRALLELVALS